MKQPLVNWAFHLGDVPDAYRCDYDDSAWRRVCAPHDWQIEQPRSADAPQGSAQGYYPRNQIGWYRARVQIPQQMRGRALTLWFDALMQDSQVWINGHLLGRRPYGYVPVIEPIDAWVRFGAENTIAVRLDCTCGGDRWYSGAGMIRSAYLLDEPKMHLQPFGLAVTPQVDADWSGAQVLSAVRWQNDADQPFEGQLELTLTDPQGNCCARLSQTVRALPGQQGQTDFSARIEQAMLWSPETPRLYRAQAVLAGETYPARFGLRTLKFDRDAGFFLNGASYKMRGVNVHHDGGAAFGACCPRALWVRKLEAFKRMGCNTIRCAHNPHDPMLYELMDEMGFLCVDEYIDKWGRSRSYQGPIYDQWHEKDLTAMIRRDYNHPCVVIWSVGNEVEYQYQDETFYDTLAHLTGIVRGLDGTRAVSFALAPFIGRGYDDFAPMADRMRAVVRVSALVDVLMINYSESFYEKMHQAGLQAPILGSEIYMIYRSCDGQFRQIERQSPLDDIDRYDFVCGGLIWAGADYLGECDWPSQYWTGAPLDAAGFEKLRAAYVRAKWTAQPMVYAAVLDPEDPWDMAKNRWGFPQMRRHWNYDAPNRFQEVVVMTNCARVAVYLNDEAVRWDDPRARQDGMAHFLLPYVPGVVDVRGYDEAGVQVAQDYLRTSEKPLRLRIDVPGRVRAGTLALAQIWLLDEFGNPWSRQRPILTVRAEGAAALKALTNANFVQDGATAKQCAFVDGHALAALWGCAPGMARIGAEVPGIGAVYETIEVVEA